MFKNKHIQFKHVSEQQQKIPTQKIDIRSTLKKVGQNACKRAGSLQNSSPFFFNYKLSCQFQV